MNAVPPLQERALAALCAAMPADMFLTDDEAMDRYSRDWSGDHYGSVHLRWRGRDRRRS